MNLQNTVIRGQEIVIDDASTFNAIGDGVVSEDCVIRCHVPSKSLSIRGELIRTRVVVKKKLRGFSWPEARLRECMFEGVFQENEFGTVSNMRGFCESCNFENADLDDCIFYGLSSESHTFARWPQLVLMQPHANLGEMQARPKSDALAIIVDSTEYLDEEATAITYNAESLAKRSAISVEEIREFFSQFSFVRM